MADAQIVNTLSKAANIKVMSPDKRKLFREAKQSHSIDNSCLDSTSCSRKTVTDYKTNELACDTWLRRSTERLAELPHIVIRTGSLRNRNLSKSRNRESSVDRNNSPEPGEMTPTPATATEGSVSPQPYVVQTGCFLYPGRTFHKDSYMVNRRERTSFSSYRRLEDRRPTQTSASAKATQGSTSGKDDIPTRIFPSVIKLPSSREGRLCQLNRLYERPVDSIPKSSENEYEVPYSIRGRPDEKIIRAKDDISPPAPEIEKSGTAESYDKSKISCQIPSTIYKTKYQLVNLSETERKERKQQQQQKEEREEHVEPNPLLQSEEAELEPRSESGFGKQSFDTWFNSLPSRLPDLELVSYERNDNWENTDASNMLDSDSGKSGSDGNDHYEIISTCRPVWKSDSVRTAAVRAGLESKQLLTHTPEADCSRAGSTGREQNGVANRSSCGREQYGVANRSSCSREQYGVASRSSCNREQYGVANRSSCSRDGTGGFSKSASDSAYSSETVELDDCIDSLTNVYENAKDFLNTIHRVESERYKMSLKKKETLLIRMRERVRALEIQQYELDKEICSNETTGIQLATQLSLYGSRKEVNQFNLHVEELESISVLILGLARRLARTEKNCDEMSDKVYYRNKRDKLLTQMEEAQWIQNNIDKRTWKISRYLEKYLGTEGVLMFQSFISDKIRLVTESREVGEKLKLGRKQLRDLEQPRYYYFSDDGREE